MVAWFIPLLISLALSIVSYLLMPKPKQPKPEAAKDMDAPTADAGRPIPVIFGQHTIKSPNVLWYGQKFTQTKKVKS